MNIKNVAIYLRKSRDDGAETKEETLARHERMLTEYCKRNNLTIIKTYKEVVSGESLEARPQALQMLDDVSSKMFDGVVTIELERLSRGNQVDQFEIMEVFKKSQTKIYTLNKIYDLSLEDGFDEEFFEFGLFMSRREYKTIKRRLQRGKKQAQKEGYYTGSNLPFGFSKVRDEKGCILIPNEQASIVQLIFDKFVNEDWSVAQIVDYLNSNGIKPVRSNVWTKTVIRCLLKNKLYIGFINTNSGVSRNKAICYKGKHEAIIDIETFEKAGQKLLIAIPRNKFGTGLTNPLASLLFCSNCNHAMSKRGEYYTCDRYGCNTSSANFHIVENRIIEELKNELKNFNYFIENYGDEIKKEHKTKQQEIKIIEKQIIKKEQMINRVCEMLEMGVYSLDKYLERINIINAEIDALKKYLETIDNKQIQNFDRTKKAIPILEKCLTYYWNLDPKQKNELLKSIVEKVEYTKTKRNVKNKKGENLELKIYLKI